MVNNTNSIYRIERWTIKQKEQENDLDIVLKKNQWVRTLKISCFIAAEFTLMSSGHEFMNETKQKTPTPKWNRL